MVVIGVQGIPELNQILLKSYPCGADPCVVAKGYRLSLKSSHQSTKLYPCGVDPYLVISMVLVNQRVDSPLYPCEGAPTNMNPCGVNNLGEGMWGGGK